MTHHIIVSGDFAVVVSPLFVWQRNGTITRTASVLSGAAAGDLRKVFVQWYVCVCVCGE